MNFFDKRLVLLAVPGFIALFTANFLSDMPTIRDSQLPFVYFILSLIILGPPFLVSILVLKISKHSMGLSDLLQNYYFGASTVLFSIFVGFGFGVLNTTDVVSKYLRVWLKIPERFFLRCGAPICGSWR